MLKFHSIDAEQMLHEIAGNTPCYDILHTHSECVCKKATELATKSSCSLDLEFVQAACWLHDVGIIFTNAPDILCFGSENYMCHGILGAKLLRSRGFEAIARVCETHIGVGLTREDILLQALPLPARDYLPISLEEKLVCYADQFFSKNPSALKTEKTFKQIQKSTAKHGEAASQRLQELYTLFGI